MVEIPKDRETALDIVWAAIHNSYDAWKRVFPGTKGCSRNDVASVLGWSYMTVHRLVAELEKREQVVVTWNHQHQSYWEGLLRTSDFLQSDKEVTNKATSDFENTFFDTAD